MTIASPDRFSGQGPEPGNHRRPVERPDVAEGVLDVRLLPETGRCIPDVVPLCQRTSSTLTISSSTGQVGGSDDPARRAAEVDAPEGQVLGHMTRRYSALLSGDPNFPR